jgi:hypothetical protein
MRIAISYGRNVVTGGNVPNDTLPPPKWKSIVLPETRYTGVSTISGFHGGDYEECRLLGLAPYRSYVNRRFGGTYRLHLQGSKIRERGTSVTRLLRTEIYKHRQHIRVCYKIEVQSIIKLIWKQDADQGDVSFVSVLFGCDFECATDV